MSIKFLSAHTIRSGDTADSLVREYRLSSWQAIAEIPANNVFQRKLRDRENLPIGLVLNIPPSAPELTRERIYTLNRVRPACLTHFDMLRDVAQARLRQPVLATDAPADSAAVRQALSVLQAEVDQAIHDIARQTLPLVDICRGMAYTHVAQATDKAVSESADDPNCGLYWAITRDVLGLWSTLWQEDQWLAKWQDQDAESSWQTTCQYQNTVGSLVVQRIDQRIRDALALQQQLLRESGR